MKGSGFGGDASLHCALFSRMFFPIQSSLGVCFRRLAGLHPAPFNVWTLQRLETMIEPAFISTDHVNFLALLTLVRSLPWYGCGMQCLAAVPLFLLVLEFTFVLFFKSLFWIEVENSGSVERPIFLVSIKLLFFPEVSSLSDRGESSFPKYEIKLWFDLDQTRKKVTPVESGTA